MSAVSEYLTEYAEELSQKIETIFQPLHHRGDPFPLPPLSRKPIGGQIDAVAAIVKAMQHGHKTVNLIGALGSGKSYVSALAIHTHAAGKPYRAIVMCPPHLTSKWVREVLATIPSSRPRIIERYTDLTKLAQMRAQPRYSEFFIVSDSMAKLGPAWRPAAVACEFLDDERELSTHYRCPQCHAVLRKKHDGIEDAAELLDIATLSKRRQACSECSGALWQWTDQPARWPIASYIHKHMPGMFDYGVLDEIHGAAGTDTSIAHAASAIVQSVEHCITLTGTYLNGYAHGIMHLMWRTSPKTLHAMGFRYGQTMEFARRYGRLEKTLKAKVAPSNRKSKGSQGSTSVKVRPGVMPSLVGDHLLANSVFLSLEDIAKDLPPFERSVVSVAMDAEQRAEYNELEKAASAAFKLAFERKDMRLVSRLVHAMIGYPDHPHGYDSIGYTDEGGEYVELVAPRSLSRETVRPKEQALVDLVAGEVASGRQCWVFCEMTQKRDVQFRLESLLKERGLKARVLRSQAVPTAKREEWIAKTGPTVDVIIGHPKLTAVGLDFFGRRPRGGYDYNFPTLIFYQTPMETSIARQASGRAFRIGQSEPCKVIHLHYTDCIEQRLVQLLGAKIAASEAVDGKFSVDGLSSLSDSGESMGLALARSLMDSMASRKLSLRTAV